MYLYIPNVGSGVKLLAKQLKEGAKRNWLFIIHCYWGRTFFKYTYFKLYEELTYVKLSSKGSEFWLVCTLTFQALPGIFRLETSCGLGLVFLDWVFFVCLFVFLHILGFARTREMLRKRSGIFCSLCSIRSLPTRGRLMFCPSLILF